MMKYFGFTLTLFISLVLLVTYPSYAEYGFGNITGLWLFDEGEGAVASDSSSQNNEGQIHGATWVDGKFGKALQFDGTDDWIEVD